jgi:PAS domain S-box-containing protein
LKHTKEELQDFLENAAVAIHWVNEQGTIVYVNRAELELLGYSKEEYLGHNIAEFYVEQDEIDDIFRRLKSKEEIQNNEVKLRCKNGAIRHALVSSNVAWNEGQFIHTRCFTRDITPRKKNESLLVLLNNVSQELVSELEFDVALDRVAKLVVPQFSDWFAVYLLKDHSVGLLKSENSDKEKFSPANAYRSKTAINLNKFKPNSMAWVLKIGKPVHLEQVGSADLERVATDPEHLQLLINMEIKSLIFVPMIMKGSVIGAVSFISISPHRFFDAQDFTFAQDLVARIAFSVENVRLFNEARALKAKYILQQQGKMDEQ